MPLKIKPVRLNRSIYVRVPNDIADLIGIAGEADITLRVQDSAEEFLLIYSIRKTPPVPMNMSEQIHAAQPTSNGAK